MAKKGELNNYTPVRGYILAKPLDSFSSKSNWSIEDANKTPHRSKAIRIGDSTWYEHIDREFKSPVNEGDIFIHSSFGFEGDVRINGDEYRLVPFGKVLLIEK